jgi:hypothetical protein
MKKSKPVQKNDQTKKWLNISLGINIVLGIFFIATLSTVFWIVYQYQNATTASLDFARAQHYYYCQHIEKYHNDAINTEGLSSDEKKYLKVVKLNDYFNCGSPAAEPYLSKALNDYYENNNIDKKFYNNQTSE